MVDRVFDRVMPLAVGSEVELTHGQYRVGHSINNRSFETQRNAVSGLLRHLETSFLFGGGDQSVAPSRPE